MSRTPERWVRLVCTVGLASWLMGVSQAVAQSPEQSSTPASPAPASPLLRAGGETTFVSSYVWRGFVEGDKPCLQPGGWIGLGPVSLEGWMNLEMADGRLHNAEYDLSLFYTHESERVTVTGGLTNYFFDTPEGGRERHSELALVLSGGGLLNPSVEAYYSVSAEKGAHVTTSVSHPFPLAPHAAVTAEVALGYNHRMWLDRAGFSDVRGTVKLSLDRGSERFRLETGLDYTHALMRDQFSNRLVAFLAFRGE